MYSRTICFENQIIGFPLKSRIIACNDNPKTVIVIHDPDTNIFPICVKQKMIIRITWQNEKIVIFNCYIPLKDKLDTYIQEIENALNQLSEEILIMGDFNAKDPLGRQIIGRKRKQSNRIYK